LGLLILRRFSLKNAIFGVILAIWPFSALALAPLASFLEQTPVLLGENQNL